MEKFTTTEFFLIIFSTKTSGIRSSSRTIAFCYRIYARELKKESTRTAKPQLKRHDADTKTKTLNYIFTFEIITFGGTCLLRKLVVVLLNHTPRSFLFVFFFQK